MHATLLVLAGMLWVAATARAEFYQWTDASGTVHYSDRIEDVPDGARRQIEVPELGAAGAGERPPAAAEGSTSSPMPELGLEAWAQAAGGAGDAGSADVAESLAALGAMGGLGLGVVLLGVLVALLVSALLYAALILLGCRVLSYERPGFGRAFAIAGMQTIAYTLVSVVAILLFGFSLQDPAGMQRAQGASWLLGILAQVALFWAMLCESVGKAVILTIVITALGVAIALAVGLVAALVWGGAVLLGGAA